MPTARPTSTRRYLDIVTTLTRREVRGRHSGTLFGIGTALVVPAAFLLVYGLVFTAIVPVRLGADARPTDYVFFLFAGLVAWNLVSETVSRGPTLFEANASLLRKSEFPGTALVVASAATAWIHAQLWVGVFVLARSAFGEPVHATVLLAPLILLGIAAFAAGVALLLASLGGFVRDLNEWTPPALTLMLFLSPVLYPADRIEKALPGFLDFSPISPMLGALRAVLIEGTGPAATDVMGIALWALVPGAFALVFHRRVRSALADLVA
jgi:lipopolysaccharide transport system permease protein